MARNRMMMVTAYHMVDNLASGLYESLGQRLMELIRNGLVASMADYMRKWEPEGVKMEVNLVSNHPLSPNRGTALVVLDHGCGMTETSLERYFNWLGTPLDQLTVHQSNPSHNGASQKGIGRLAALALNKLCLDEDVMVRISNGYHLFSRTAPNGPVRFVSVIPKDVEADGGFNIERFISPQSTELANLKGIKGSFTAIVIPTPVFKNHKTIYQAVQWMLPRDPEKMFNLYIGGKLAEAPPLEDAVSIDSVDGCYRARLGKGDTGSDGIWLCDAETGLRVASCQRIGRSLLPDPLWYPDIVGDIFVPGLLRHQNTSRSGLAKDFARKGNSEWKKLRAWLEDEVVPAALKLIERDTIDGDAAQTLDDVAEMFNECFGVPEDENTPREKRLRAGGSGGGGASTNGDRESSEERKYRRVVTIKVRDEVYYLYRGQSLSAYLFAIVSPSDSRVIFTNVRGSYEAMPDTKAAAREHALMQILGEIGRSKFPADRNQATLFANEVRAQFLMGTKKNK